MDFNRDIECAKESHYDLYIELLPSYHDFVSRVYNDNGQIIDMDMYQLFIRWDIATNFSKCVEFLKLHEVAVEV